MLDVLLGVCLRVEGEDALVVAAHQEDGWQVLGEHLQPGHVQGAGHRPLPGQRQAPAIWKKYVLNYKLKAM